MIDVEIVPLAEAKALCLKYHYSNIFPPHCMVTLGFHDQLGLAGVAIWGWGVRPRHTIKKLFPSLDTKDYWELVRLCCRDDLVRNTESQLLAGCVRWFRQYQKDKVLLYTWADGIRGKPGYIYQASNWLYGGYIETEIYLTQDNEPVHPRFMITRFGSRAKKVWQALGLRKIRGKQFRYCYFLCNHKERKRLLRESTVEWMNKRFPKHEDLLWRIDAGEGSRETRYLPKIERSGQFRQSAHKTNIESTSENGLFLY